MIDRCFRLRLSTALTGAFEDALRREGYGPRQKGRWLGEALERLQREDSALEKVGVGDDLDVPRDRSISFSLCREHFRLLEHLVLRFRQSAPLVEGVRALVVRSAIRLRVRAST